jgi:hypothetical protein
MKTKKNINILIGALFVITIHLASPAEAALIDFTEAPFFPGFVNPSHTVSVSGILPDDVLEITFTAVGEAGSKPILTWFRADGFGVARGGGYEFDEVELPEMLLIEFSVPIIAHSFEFTDFFVENGYAETGLYSLMDGNGWIVFTATDLSGDDNNGTFELLLDDMVIHAIAFTALGDVAGLEDHELAIAGANISAVPIPSSIFLIGSALIGLIVFWRKR